MKQNIIIVVGDWVGKEDWSSGASLSSAKHTAELIISKTSIM
jgi:hypothetical protein